MPATQSRAAKSMAGLPGFDHHGKSRGPSAGFGRVYMWALLMARQQNRVLSGDGVGRGRNGLKVIKRVYCGFVIQDLVGRSRTLSSFSSGEKPFAGIRLLPL